MGNLSKVLIDEGTKISKFMDKNSPMIFTTVGVIGFVAATVVIAKNTPKAQEIVEKTKEDILEAEEVHEDYPDDFGEDDLKKEKASLYFDCCKDLIKVYGIGVTLMASATYCVFKAQKTNSARIASWATAYQLEHVAKEELQNKTIEMFGEKKFEKIRDEINKDRVKDSNPRENDILTPDGGEMLCYDSLSGRYFKSNPDKLHKAENLINKRMFADMEFYATLNDFYREINLPGIGVGDSLGWNSNTGLELYLTSCLTENETPCLVIDYNIAPKYDYREP